MSGAVVCLVHSGAANTSRALLSGFEDAPYSTATARPFTPRMPPPANSFPLVLPSILVVDDDRDGTVFAQHLIAKTGVRNPVVLATGGREALEHLRRCCSAGGADGIFKPGLLLLDVNMPEMSGLDVLRWVRAHPSFKETKVILWSASERHADHEMAARYGADAIFSKYPQVPVLGAALRVALESPPAADAAGTHAKPSAAA